MKLSIDKLTLAMGKQQYRVFRNGDYNLNLVGIRSADMTANSFNDVYCVFFQHNGNPHLYIWPCTTDPGLYYRQHPANVNGAAVLVPGQYRGAWQLGKHQGKYDALTQAKPVTVYRDNNRDNVADTDGATETGFFGINHHRANAGQESTRVDKWSAGCQVLANPDDYRILIALIKKAITLWPNSFTYTLLTEADLEAQHEI